MRVLSASASISQSTESAISSHTPIGVGHHWETHGKPTMTVGGWVVELRGDGLLNDVNSDGSFIILDMQAVFAALSG
jgi:hypothetical protein